MDRKKKAKIIREGGALQELKSLQAWEYIEDIMNRIQEDAKDSLATGSFSNINDVYAKQAEYQAIETIRGQIEEKIRKKQKLSE